MNNYIYIAVMAAVSYTIRVLPLTLIRKPIKNQFIQSFLYYVPYVTLAVMTFPAIVQATQLLQDAQKRAEQHLLEADPPPIRLEQTEQTDEE